MFRIFQMKKQTQNNLRFSINKRKNKMFKIEKIIEIDVKDLNEWVDNPINRQSIPDLELRNSLEKDGLMVDTIAVVPNGVGYTVIDGNRRLRIVKELGIEGKFMAKVYNRDVDKISLAIKLNGIGNAWNRQAYTQFVIGHPERIDLLPKRFKSETKKAYDLLGKDFKWFALNCRPNAYDWGVLLAKYLGRGDDEEFVKKTVLWVGRYKLVRQARQALDSLASKSMIEKAILADKPLKTTVITDN